MCSIRGSWLVAVFEVTPKPEFAAFEISAALTWTRQAANVQLDLAYSIVRQFPLLHAAMAAGDVDLSKARVIVDGVPARSSPYRTIIRGPPPGVDECRSCREASFEVSGHPGQWAGVG